MMLFVLPGAGAGAMLVPMLMLVCRWTLCTDGLVSNGGAAIQLDT